MADKTTITGAVEQSVIALILDDPSINLSLATDAGVTSDWFEDGRCRAVWDAALRMDEDGQQIEAITVIGEAQRIARSDMERYGIGTIDVDWYEQITQYTTDGADIDPYLTQLGNAYRARELRHAMQEAGKALALTGDVDASLRALMTRAQELSDCGGDDATGDAFVSLADLPPFRPESENEDILIRGRWLERGGAAFVVSTAGTGKSIHSVQGAMCWSMGLPFAGLSPRKALKIWIFQSEDSPSRVAIDREDITAELREQHPNVDWSEAWRRVKLVKLRGKVGAEWLDSLRRLLASAKRRGDLPDVIIINPFLAFIGGPITDGQYVTPFLRGGTINRVKTCGLQAILEEFSVGALIYHHTPKPPSAKEIDAWIKSPFPEYQGAGSSDITNWGRSFITMMKVPNNPRMVMLTAGKNGGGLGWDEVDGARRKYLHWSDGDSVDTGARHAWREATEDEIDAAMAGKSADATDAADKESLTDWIVSQLRSKPMSMTDARGLQKASGAKRTAFREALDAVVSNAYRYGLERVRVKVGRGVSEIIGEVAAANRLAAQMRSDAGDSSSSSSSFSSSQEGSEGPFATVCHRLPASGEDLSRPLARGGIDYIYNLPSAAHGRADLGNNNHLPNNSANGQEDVLTADPIF